jgi:ABC-type lipoprotein release transport system permease subunit
MSAMLVIALLVASPFLFILARRPILRRLAVRNAARRPREALLVILGSLLGAAIITGSAVVGDTMDASIRQAARQHLGPIDELVVARSAPEWRSLQSRLRALPTSTVDGVVPLASFDTATTAGGGAALRTVPNARIVGFDFDAARAFGGAAAATGVSGPTPAPGHAAITTDLARALDVGPGGQIDVYAYGRPSTLTVDRVLPRVGLAGFSLNGQQEARNVLVSPSVFAAMVHRRPVNAAPPSWYVAVSNRGGIESGAGLSTQVTHSIEQATAGIDPQITDVKRQFLDVADETGKSFTQMFTAMGSFGVFAGLLLLINLFVMLAAERKSELGMARAVGMRRSQLVGAFATEGFIYALLATLLGTAVGVGLGRVLVAWSQSAFSSEHNRFDLYFTVKPASLTQSFVIGFVVAVATIVVMSIRVSRLNIIRAIRDIAEPPPPRRKRWLYAGFAGVALGALWTVSAVASKEPFGLLLGPTLVFIGLAPFLTRVAPARTAASVLAAATVTWGALVFALFPDSAEGASIMMYVAQGIVMTAGGVAFATLQLDHLSSGLHRFGSRLLALRLGLAYPLARRGRTGLTVSMYALVVFILTFITSISFMIDKQVSTAAADVSGGAKVFVRSSTANPVSIAALTRTPGVRMAAPLAQVEASFALANSPEEHFWPMSAFDGSLLQLGPPKLEDVGAERPEPDHRRPDVPPAGRTAELQRQGRRPHDDHQSAHRRISRRRRRRDREQRRVDRERHALRLERRPPALRRPARSEPELRLARARHERRDVRGEPAERLHHERGRGLLDRRPDRRGVRDDASDLPALPGLSRDGAPRRHRRHRRRDDPRSPRATAPDRDAACAGFPRAVGGTELRDRGGVCRLAGNADRRSAGAADAVYDRRPLRRDGRRDVRSAVLAARGVAGRHRHRVPRRDDRPRDVGDADQAGGGAADDELTRERVRENPQSIRRQPGCRLPAPLVA